MELEPKCWLHELSRCEALWNIEQANKNAGTDEARAVLVLNFPIIVQIAHRICTGFMSLQPSAVLDAKHCFESNTWNLWLILHSHSDD